MLEMLRWADNYLKHLCGVQWVTYEIVTGDEIWPRIDKDGGRRHLRPKDNEKEKPKAS